VLIFMSECRLGSRARKGSSGRLAIAAWVALAAISCERAPDVDDAWTVPVAPVPNGDPRLPGVARVDAGLQRTLDRALAAQPDADCLAATCRLLPVPEAYGAAETEAA